MRSGRPPSPWSRVRRCSCFLRSWSRWSRSCPYADRSRHHQRQPANRAGRSGQCLAGAGSIDYQDDRRAGRRAGQARPIVGNPRCDLHFRRLDAAKLQIASLETQVARTEAELEAAPLVFAASQIPIPTYAALQKALYCSAWLNIKAQLTAMTKIKENQATIRKASR